MSNYFLCARCHHLLGLGGGDGDVMLRCNCGETEPKVMVDHHGIDGIRYEKPTDVCPWYLPGGDDDGEPAPHDRNNPVSGMRVWRVDTVEARCPHCKTVNSIDADWLTDDEIWANYGPFEHECEDCHRYFWIEVDDDDR